MPISALPTAPSPSDTPSEFNTKAFAFLGALSTFRTEANALETAVDADALAVSTAAGTATTQAGIATTQANNALASANAAAQSAIDASGAATSAINAFDSFDDRYLGAKANDPTTDNDGNALVTGALYYRTGDGMRVWSGSAWAAAYLPAAGYATLTGNETLTNKTLVAPVALASTTATQDGVIVTGRAGGSSSHRVTIAPTTLSASRAVTLPDAAGTVLLTTAAALANNNLTGIKNATFNTQNTIATTTGNITVDWTLAQNQLQTEPTGTITYTFTAPPGPCHLQLIINSDGTSTAQTINWPGGVIQYGTTWAGANNKRAVINFWYDGSTYHMIGTNQV
jgi:hypothetical protein